MCAACHHRISHELHWLSSRGHPIIGRVILITRGGGSGPSPSSPTTGQGASYICVAAGARACAGSSPTHDSPSHHPSAPPIDGAGRAKCRCACVWATCACAAAWSRRGGSQRMTLNNVHSGIASEGHASAPKMSFLCIMSPSQQQRQPAQLANADQISRTRV